MRAAELLRPYRLDVALELEAAWSTNDLDGRAAVQVADTLADRAAASGDHAGASLARATGLCLRVISGELGYYDEQEALCRAALPLEEERDDPRRVALLWFAVGVTAQNRMHCDDAVAALERAFHHSRRAGDSPSSITLELDWALILKPRPADEGMRILDELVPGRPPGDSDLARAVLLAMLGRIDEAWPLAEARSEHLREVTGGIWADAHLAAIAIVEGDRERACRHHEALIEALPPGTDGIAASFRLPLARDLCYLGRLEAAERELHRAQAVAPGPVGRSLRPTVILRSRAARAAPARRGGPLFELMVELGDLAVERAATGDELARESHLELLLLAGEPAADALQVGGAGEHPQRHLVGRVELVQVPAQPLMSSPALVDDRVAVIDQHLQLAKRPLVRPGPAQIRLAHRCPRDRERVDRVRLAPRSTCAPLRRHQLRRHPHQLLTGREQLPLQPARQLPAVLQRPQPLLAEARPMPSSSSLPTATVRSSSIRPASSTATAVTDCLCTSTPITIISDRLLNRWGRPASGQTSLEARPRSYQVTLGGLGRRRRHNAGKSALGRHPGIESAAAARVCDSYRTRHPPRMTLSSRSTPSEPGLRR